ncbi:MAG TPA: menaquinone biosynthesis protein [Candidatus Polarisedimenticolaceae bacterium]|nr:menaquinone biosynthesis protein [Candidatus Polarisedimenticolaceae bacterium]
MIRIGTVPYLNARPLVFGFEHGTAADRVRLESDVPSQLAARLRRQTLDGALVSSIELGRIPGLTVVPGLAIGSHGPVRSVLLVSRVPLDRIRTLALDPASRTSNALAEILLRERFGVAPAAEECRGTMEEALVHHDAVLRIGDAALFSNPPAGTSVTDLGEIWTAWTSLPFVYAVWVAREGVLDEGLCEAFQVSAREGLQSVDAIAAETRDPDLVRRYLTENIRYGLGPKEMAGLQRFLELAAARALLPRVPEVRLERSTA